MTMAFFNSSHFDINIKSLYLFFRHRKNEKPKMAKRKTKMRHTGIAKIIYFIFLGNLSGRIFSPLIIEMKQNTGWERPISLT